MERRFLRVEQAAEFLGLRPQTLNRWRVEGGKLPFSRIGRAIVYDRVDLERFVELGRRDSTSAPAVARDGTDHSSRAITILPVPAD